MIRSIETILIEADSCKSLKELIALWNEIADNKKKYPLIQIRFANERIRELALKSEGQDIDKGRFYHTLSQMYSNS